MSFTNQTTHYGLPQWIGSDKPTYLVDQNNAYQTIDSEIYNANTTAGAAQTAAAGAVATAGAASSTAADALSAAQTASSTADSALTEAQTANTNAQAAQTAAGAAQTAAQAAQEAAAGNSITNLAPAYDSTITYAVDDLVTAEGKLYKCIVAVTSPEQFDINKWDDVTTSEVYQTKGNYYTKRETDDKFVIRGEPLTQITNLINTSSSVITFTDIPNNFAIGDNNLVNTHFIGVCNEVVSGTGYKKIGTINRTHQRVQYGYALLVYSNDIKHIVNLVIEGTGEVKFSNPNISETLLSVVINSTLFI